MKKLIPVVLFAAAVLVSFGFGFGWRDIQDGQAPRLAGLTNLFSGSANDQTPTEIFQDHFTYILRNSRNEPGRDDLKYSAMQGMFASLGDPHTSFLEPQIAQDFARETEGSSFVGVGAFLSQDPIGAKVYNLFKDGPADRAGLKRNDVITQVDDVDVTGMPVTEIVTYIRGEVGTEVTLHVIRQGEDTTVPITIERQRLEVPTVISEMIDSVGYVSISQFAGVTDSQFSEELSAILNNDPSGIVIDLRGNPGGLLDVAKNMLGRFLDRKVVIEMRQRGNEVHSVRTPPRQTYDIDVPVVVLINEQSASASEIMAGVLRDYDIATLIGEHTYGKASVQNVKGLADMSSAKITIARYFLPSGEDISRRVDEEGQYLSGGLAPDIEVELEMTPETTMGDPETDNQLKAALEFIERRTD